MFLYNCNLIYKIISVRLTNLFVEHKSLCARFKYYNHKIQSVVEKLIQN